MAKKDTTDTSAASESEAAEETASETESTAAAATETEAGSASSSEDTNTEKTQEETTMADDKVSFDALVSQYGVDKSIARGLKSKMNPPADGLVKETDFVTALKEYAGGTPK